MTINNMRNTQLSLASGRRTVPFGLFLCTLFLFCMLGGVPFGYESLWAAESAEQIIPRLQPACVSLFSPRGDLAGSGTVVSTDGFVFTVAETARISGNWGYAGLSNGEVCPAVLVSVDPTGGVALYKMFPPSLLTAAAVSEGQEGQGGQEGQTTAPPKPIANYSFNRVQFGNSLAVRATDIIYALGNPLGTSGNLVPSATRGIVSATRRFYSVPAQDPKGSPVVYPDCLQLNAGIAPGMFGGPVFDEQGRFVGMSAACKTTDENPTNSGVSFAISSNQLNFFLSAMRGGRIVDHASLGAIVEADELGRPVIKDLPKYTDAWQQGIRPGDVVSHLNERRVNSVNDFLNAQGVYPSGWLVPIRYLRRSGGKVESVDAMVRMEGFNSTIKRQKSFDQMNIVNVKPVPDWLAGWISTRKGFVNYSFNKLERDRVWRLFGNGSATRITKIEGQTSLGAKFNLTIADAQSELNLPAHTIFWKTDKDYNSPAISQTTGKPDVSGLILPGLTVWADLISTATKRYEKLNYAGLSGLRFFDKPEEKNAFYEVLDGNVRGMDVRLYFTRKKGDSMETSRLVLLEIPAWDDGPTWEFRFEDYQNKSSGWLPRKVRVVRGSETLETFTVLGVN